MTDEAKTRRERDSLGEIDVPQDARWQAQTQRAVDAFAISGESMPATVIRALAAIKAAAAQANARRGVIDADVGGAVRAAASGIARGEHADQFPVDVFQTGSGTSTNMNVNEVVATLASQSLGYAVHPNDVVNASQSSNDTVPSAVHIAAADATVHRLLPALADLAATLRARAAEHQDTVKAGRTHLMDATPLTYAQELGAWATQVEQASQRISDSLPRVCALPLGGTAVGTGLNAPPGFASDVIGTLAQQYELPLTEAADHFEAQASRDSLVELSGQLRGLAVSLTKICNDLRWQASGPNTGLAEITLAAVQPGSSIMPGKTNPVIPEAVLQVCSQVVGHDAAIAWAGASGSFQLNVQVPLIARNLMHSLTFLTAAVRLLDRCVADLTVNADRMHAYAEASPAIVTALNGLLGYDEAAAVVAEALRDRRSIRDVVLARGHVAASRVTETQLDAALDPLRMSRPPSS